jgi:hypothetical protein
MHGQKEKSRKLFQVRFDNMDVDDSHIINLQEFLSRYGCREGEARRGEVGRKRSDELPDGDSETPLEGGVGIQLTMEDRLEDRAVESSEQEDMSSSNGGSFEGFSRTLTL